MHMKWAKYILGVNSKSTNIAVTAELGRYPLIIEIIVNAVKFWLRVKNAKQNSLLFNCYQANVEITRSGGNCWLSTIEKIAKMSNFHYYLDNEKVISQKVTKFLKERFDIQFKKDLFNDERSENGGNKLRTFRKFKDDIHLEPYLGPYLTKIRENTSPKNLTKLRISAHNLHIETGRHVRPHKTPLLSQTCSNCTDKIENEFHIIIECKNHEHNRQHFLENIRAHNPQYSNLINENLFLACMKSKSSNDIRELHKLIKHICKTRGNF